MAKETVYNNTLVSGAADETLTYTRYVKDESSGKSTKELLDEKVNKTDQLGTTQIADKAVTTEKLENESVTTDKLNAASVTTDKVADANITTSKLADSSVETEKINNKAVTTDKLNDGAVDNAKLSPNAVTSEKIKNESIITEKLNDRAVTTEKIEEKAITNAKLGDQSVDGRVVREASLETKHFANESVTTEKVARKSITKDKLADNAVDASQVVDGSIGNAKLSPDSVTTEKIKNGSVTNEKIADNTLGIGKFDPELRKTIQAATGLPDDLNQMIQDIDQSVKQLHEKDTDLQSQIDDKQQQITANDDDISLLQTRSTQMEEAIKGISASGGASQASAVTYENTESGLDSVTAQGAIDELASKNKSQDTEIAKKANSADVDSQIQTEQERVNAELDKKFDKENIAQEFGDSEDKVVSQFALPFREIESPEFIKVIVDAEDHFLFGIQLDGSVEWGKGVPAPIRQRIQEVMNYVGDEFASLSDKIESIKLELSGSLQTYQQTTDATLANLQENKVDKEEDKSLIEDEVKECFKVIENEEFIIAITDADDKVLFGIYRDSGKPYFPLNEMYHVEQNKEFFAVWLDTANHVLLGIRRDGQIIGEIHAVNALKQAISQLQSDLASLQEKVGTIDSNLKELLDVFSLQENPEYLAVEEDADGKVLSATYNDGSHYIHNAKSETIPTEFEHIEDPEGRTEITTDAENKVMSYRDSSGKKHEHAMEVTNLDVSNLNLQGNSVNNIQDALKANGFDVKTPVDWSDEKELQIPEPRCAFANITGAFPMTKGNTTKGVIQFYDMQGNYFKKYIEMDIHGRTSAAFKKKNYTLDFYNDEEYSDSFKLRFGDWVAMDSYYFQGWYTDSFRGIDIIAYKLYQQIVETRGFMNDKPFKSKIMEAVTSDGQENVKDVEINLGKNALCTPMGFPIILYHNNEFWGIYTIMLKKNRANFLMNKNDYKAVMLDLDQNNIIRGDKNWASFEIRNPKTLICMDGTKYDGDNPKELIDETSEKYDSANKNMKNSVITKNAILNLANAYLEIQEAISNSKTNEEIKKLVESNYNVDFIIDYIIFSNIIENVDGWGGNWQWTTWDGIKWNPNPYDLNAAFGLSPYGITSSTPSESISSSTIAKVVYDYYLDAIKERYQELRDKKVISVENIINLFKEWIKRIGTDNYQKEFSKWNTTPSQRDSNLNSEYWERASSEKNHFAFSTYNKETKYNKNAVVWGGDGKLYRSIIDNNVGNTVSDTESWECVTYDETKEYQVNDTCYYSKGVSIMFKCKKKCIREPPITALYDESYGIYGFYDSIGRIYQWVNKRIEIMNNLLK